MQNISPRFVQLSKIGRGVNLRSIAFAFGFALAACGQAPTQTGQAPTTQGSASEFALACEDFGELTPDALAARFGAENISTQTLPGAEGEPYEATVVFANDPARRLEVVWNEARTAPASVSVNTAGTQWSTAEHITIGTSIGDVERANVMPFKLWGFGWDYGGWVSDWNAGTLSQSTVPGCRLRVHFDARTDPGVGASGDSEFNSNDPAIRAADPAVSEFGLMFGTPE